MLLHGTLILALLALASSGLGCLPSGPSAQERLRQFALSLPHNPLSIPQLMSALKASDNVVTNDVVTMVLALSLVPQGSAEAWLNWWELNASTYWQLRGAYEAGRGLELVKAAQDGPRWKRVLGLRLLGMMKDWNEEIMAGVVPLVNNPNGNGSEEDITIAKEAASCLKGHRSPTAEDALLISVRKPRLWANAALEVLASDYPEAALPEAKAIVLTASEESLLTTKAVQTLAALGRERAIPDLQVLYKRFGNRGIGRWAAVELVSLGDKAYVEPVIATLCDEQKDVAISVNGRPRDVPGGDLVKPVLGSSSNLSNAAETSLEKLSGRRFRSRYGIGATCDLWRKWWKEQQGEEQR